LFDILRTLRSIIFREKGNHILVNVSVGSKIQAIASMMACMMFKDMATIKSTRHLDYCLLVFKVQTKSTY
jgi:hypothetical protein